MTDIRKNHSSDSAPIPDGASASLANAAGDTASGGNGGKPLSRAQKFQQENDAKIAAAEKAARDKREAASNLQPVTNGEDLSGAHASLGIVRNRSDARDITLHGRA
jgi:hypothetical protein